MDLVTVQLTAANKQLAAANTELTGAITQLTADNARLTAIVASLTGVARCHSDARSGNAASTTDQVCAGSPSASRASVWPALSPAYAPRCSPVSTCSPSISTDASSTTAPTADPMLSSAAGSSPEPSRPIEWSRSDCAEYAKNQVYYTPTYDTSEGAYSPSTPAFYNGMSPTVSSPDPTVRPTEDSHSPPSTAAKIAALYSGLSADEDSADDGDDEADDAASTGTATHPLRIDDATDDEEETPLVPGTVSSHPVDLTDACGCDDGCAEESVAIAGGPARLLGCRTDPPHPLKPSVDAVLWDRLTRVEVGCFIILIF